MKRNNNIEAGTFLVAQPFLSDPYFKRSVILLCDHHPDGTFGFILNKSVKMNINELLEDFPDFDAEVFYGGPVSTDTIHFIHNVGNLLEDSQKVTQGIYWGGDFDRLKFLINTGMILPANVRFFVGYSGWSGGQLKEEMNLGSWILGDSNSNYIFNHAQHNLWSSVLQNKGNTYSVIAQLPDYYINN